MRADFSEMNSRSAHVICGGLTFEEVPVELREKVAFRDAQLPDALAQMKDMLGLREAVLVSTCNRVEYFGATEHPDHAFEAWPDFLRRFHSVNDDFSRLSSSCAACHAWSISTRSRRA